MRVLRPHLSSCRDPVRPVNDERVADAAAIGLTLPAAEGSVARPRPAPSVVVEELRATQFVERGEVLLQRLRHEVEELVLVDRPSRAAFGAGAVVGDEHDQGVVQLAYSLEKVYEPPDVVVGVLKEAGEDLHHSRVQSAFVVGERAPLGNVWVVRWKLGPLGDDAKFELARVYALAIRFPALVEGSLVPVGPLF